MLTAIQFFSTSQFYVYLRFTESKRIVAEDEYTYTVHLDSECAQETSVANAKIRGTI